MQSWEAMQRMTNGHYREIAKALHRSASLVYRWTEPVADYGESGAFNDLDRIESGIHQSLELGTPDIDAFAPIHYLANSFGGIFIPPVSSTCNPIGDAQRQLARAMKECSEAFATMSQALEDNHLTPNEKRDIVKETYEGIHELCVIVSMLDGGPK